MPKRFTATEKWNKRWFRQLDLEWKIFWIYICDNCDHCGIWDVDFETVTFFTKKVFKESEIPSVIMKRIYKINSDKWFIKKFIPFQYGKLNKNSNMYISIEKRLKQFNLSLNEPLPDGASTHMDIYKEKDKEKDKEKEVVKNNYTKRKRNLADYQSSKSAIEIRDLWNAKRWERLKLGINDSKNQTLKNIDTRIDQGYDPEILVQSVVNYYKSIKFSDRNYAYKISNFFGEKAYFKNYLEKDDDGNARKKTKLDPK